MFLTVEHWIVVGVTLTAVIACVILHFEGLRLISDRLPQPHHHRRRGIVALILCILFIHIVEIWIFGLANYALLRVGGFGSLTGMTDATLFDCVYYSAVVFTTLGFGDMVPVGHIRFLTGTEAIAGLTFITWSASYTYLAMMRTWTAR